MASSSTGDKSSSIGLREIKTWHKSKDNFANGTGLYHGVESDQIPVVTAEQGLQDLHVPALPVDALQRWNAPRANMWRTFAAFYSFLILGLAGSAYGVCQEFLSACNIALIHDSL